MTAATQEPESFIPLTPAVFHILLALADGEKHGYAIMQEAEAISSDQIKMGPGTLYGSIKRMIALTSAVVIGGGLIAFTFTGGIG